MNPKLYKTVKIRSGRPRCPHRETAVKACAPKYIDAKGLERWTSSGNQTNAKRLWETNKRRKTGTQPPIPKAMPEIIARKTEKMSNAGEKKIHTAELRNNVRIERVEKVRTVGTTGTMYNCSYQNKMHSVFTAPDQWSP